VNPEDASKDLEQEGKETLYDLDADWSFSAIEPRLGHLDAVADQDLDEKRLRTMRIHVTREEEIV